MSFASGRPLRSMPAARRRSAPLDRVRHGCGSRGRVIVVHGVVSVGGEFLVADVVRAAGLAPVDVEKPARPGSAVAGVPDFHAGEVKLALSGVGWRYFWRLQRGAALVSVMPVCLRSLSFVDAKTIVTQYVLRSIE